MDLPAHGFTEVKLTFHVTLTPKSSTIKGNACILEDLVSPDMSFSFTLFSLVFQAPLVAPSSLSEDLLDLEQVTLQEAPLPPPIQRVMDPGQATAFFSSTFFFVFCALFISFILHILGFSDESAAVGRDPADLLDRLDLSTSSIDMTDTALAMQEEKECDISGVRKFDQKSSFVSERPNVGLADFTSRFAEELEDSALSSSADNQAEQPVPSAPTAVDLPPPLTSSVNVSDPDTPTADPPHPRSGCTDAPGPESESSNGPPVTPPVTAGEPSSTPSPVDLLQFSGTCEPTEDAPGVDGEDPAE